METPKTNDYDGLPAHKRTPTPPRIIKAATTSKPNKTKSNIIHTINEYIYIYIYIYIYTYIPLKSSNTVHHTLQESYHVQPT
jgi:hypothetical protein